MSRWRVLVSAPYFQPVVERFRGRLESAGCELVVPPVCERLSEEKLLPLIGDIDGVIAGDDQFTARVFSAAPRLKVISKWGTGIDSFDSVAAQKQGVVIRNTPGAFTHPVADSVFGYVLCFARQLPWMDQDLRNGQWTKRPGRALRECVLGVIGVGNVGKAIVRRALAFGMTVLGNDTRAMPQDFLDTTGIEMVPKDELLSRADFISLNCDLNPTSHHLLGRAEFDRMRAAAYLINTARGPLVDEPALIEALRQRRIAGAALDVYEEEPLPSDSPLRTLPHCLLAPHNANASPEAYERIHESTVEHLVEELQRRA